MKTRNKLMYTSLALTGVLVGCSNSTNNAEIEVVTQVTNPVEIDFWHTMTGTLNDSLTEIVDNFNTTIGAEKGIKVVPTYQGSYSDAKAKVVGSLKSGNSPEIVQGTVNDISEYIKSGAVQSLNEYIFHEEIGIKDFDDIYEVYRNESMGYDETGTYYSLPFSKSTDLLFYNASFFKEHGLEVPTTWEEVVEVSKQATAITGKPSFCIDNSANLFITSLKQLNADYTNVNGEILFNNDKALKLVEFVKEQTDNGYWRLAGEDKYSSGPFLSEQIVMYVGSSAGEGYLSDASFEVQATFTPQWDLSNPYMIQQGNSVSILNQNKTSEEVYGAFEFIKYLVSTEANTKWCTETGYLPIRESVVNSEKVQEFAKLSSAKLNAINSVPYGFIEATFSTDTITSGIVRDKMLEMMDNVILGGLEPKKALEQYEEELKSY